MPEPKTFSLEAMLRSENHRSRADKDRKRSQLTMHADAGDCGAKQALKEVAEIAEELFPHHEAIIDDLLYIKGKLKRQNEILDRCASE